MAEKLTREQISATSAIRAYPPTQAHAQTVVNRTFELPNGLFQTTVALYLGFMAVMAFGFGNPLLILPIAVIVFTIVAGFALPTIWTRLTPESGQQAKSGARFAHEGVATGSGHSSANAASVQVLILPVLIFLWGIVAVIIAALV